MMQGGQRQQLLHMHIGRAGMWRMRLAICCAIW
jgi:hypothetical protein